MYSLSNEDTIQVYVRAVLSDGRTLDLPKLSSTEAAQDALDQVWKMLGAPSADLTALSRYRNTLRRIILKLAITYDILPTALALEEVQCDDREVHGAGGHADVYCGTYQDRKVALKRLRVYISAPEVKKHLIKRSFHRESLLWKNLVHPNIVPFIGIAENVFPGTICMVIPWMEKGSLRNYIVMERDEGRLLGRDFHISITQWIHEAALGLEYLHNEGLVHGDVHGANVLINDEGRACLTDFGMTLISDATANSYGSIHGGGAMRWSAPEVLDPEVFGLDSGRPTFDSDVFSFACTCFEIYSGAPPFHELNDSQVARRFVRGLRPSRPVSPDGDNLPDLLWSLIERGWAQKAAERPSVQTLVGILEMIARSKATENDDDNAETSLRAGFKSASSPIHVSWDSRIQNGLRNTLRNSPPGPESSTDSLISSPPSARTLDVDQAFDPEASTYSFHSLPQKRRTTSSSIYSVQSTLSPISDWGTSTLSLSDSAVALQTLTKTSSDLVSPSQQIASPEMDNAISAGLDTTDPRVIQAITQAMNGEYLYKYSHRIFGRDLRHKRFFWIHPYTRVLFWGLDDPRDANEQPYKSIMNPGPNPPGLYGYSIVVTASKRQIKLTASTREKHESWLTALHYLASQHTRPSSTPLKTKVPSILSRIRRSQIQQPSIECSSGEPQSHPSLDLVDAKSPMVSLRRVEKFVCIDGVDTAKLLRVVRSALLEEAHKSGADREALVGEQWSCVIASPTRRLEYRVYIDYHAHAIATSVRDPEVPVGLEHVKNVPGLMTIISRE
ncbi:hypothetical protein EIP91_005347 [Steccherinum ochraceum]|uniref:Protein kinase domain-containing protein n=1 Tax=Steccherinum ochraceum TaxID=92696 RepID=A0A4R0RI95_9APHY|nr:hypothetical protein EIP91_005347 [Steccherinum ochraceum]